MVANTRKRGSSLRSRIVLSFVVITALSVAWLALYVLAEKQHRAEADFLSTISALHTRHLNDELRVKEFLITGFEATSFHTDGREPNIDSAIAGKQRLLNEIQLLQNQALDLNAPFIDEITALFDHQTALLDTMTRVKTVFRERGFKDFGAEGRMREAAHLLQEELLIDELTVLRLRRHEKDYLMRREWQYVDKFNTVANAALAVEKGFGRDVLIEYREEFNELAELIAYIGSESTEGSLLYNLKQLERQTHTEFIDLYAQQSNVLADSQTRLRKALIALSLVFVVVNLVLSIVLSRRLTSELRKLRTKMYLFFRSGFTEPMADDASGAFSPRVKEIAQINTLFERLKLRLGKTLNDLNNAKSEAERIADYKSEFLANMSHEMRTPLNAIIGGATALQTAELSHEKAECVNMIKFSSNHLLQLINSVLDYSKIESGTFTLKPDSFDLGHELEQIKRIFEQKVAEKNLQLELKIGLPTSSWVIADQLRIQQVLINLMNNAIKFSDKGTVSVRVEELACDGRATRLRFEVNDEGIGMDPWQLNGLFAAFTQGESGTKKRYEGTGLGLAIAQNLVRMMGGEIKVDSKRDEGSRFHFELEFPCGEPTEQVAEPTPVIDQTVRILAAEDNTVNQAVLRLFFKTRNVECDFANNGAEAVEKFMQNSYDLILMDIQMPVMDGWEATEAIVGHAKYHAHPIPIIALTANVFDVDREKAQAVGMSGFLTKPIVADDIDRQLNSVRAVLNDCRSRA